ncbi:MAG: hypothetical protein ACK5TC_04285, partial [bacterium]
MKATADTLPVGEKTAQIQWSCSDDLDTIKTVPSEKIYIVLATKELKMICRIAKISGWIAT